MSNLKNATLTKILLALLIVISVVWLLDRFWLACSYLAGVLLTFFCAWLITLVLRTPISRLIGAGLPKSLAVATCLLGFILLPALLAALVWPDLISQTKLLQANLGPLFTDLVARSNAFTSGLGIGSLDLKETGTQLQGLAYNFLHFTFELVGGLAQFVVQGLLALIIAASLLAGQTYPGKKVDKPGPGWQKLIPDSWRKYGCWLVDSLERNFGVFLGGHFLVGLVYGLATGVVMAMAGLPYPISTAFNCAILMMIPFIGGPLSLLPPLVIGLVAEPLAVVFIMPVLYLIQTLLLNVTLPRIVGKVSPLGPVSTLFILLVGAQVGGLWGVLIGVPIGGVIAGSVEYLANEKLAASSPAPAINPANLALEAE